MTMITARALDNVIYDNVLRSPGDTFLIRQSDLRQLMETPKDGSEYRPLPGQNARPSNKPFREIVEVVEDKAPLGQEITKAWQ